MQTGGSTGDQQAVKRYCVGAGRAVYRIDPSTVCVSDDLHESVFFFSS